MVRSLRTKYQQYKRDTQMLSTWLAQAAVQHGYPLSSFGQSEQKHAPAGRKDSYVLKSHQFAEIARFLVSENILIPVELMSLIRRCVTLRASCLRRFLDMSDKSTRTHEFFIVILQEVAGILAEHRERQAAERAGGAAPSAEEQEAAKLANRFASLADLDLKDEEEEDLPDIELPQAPRQSDASASAAHVLFDLEDSPEAATMRLLVFITDLHEVRDYIRALWVDWRDGKVDLLTASVTSNTALELLRRPHADVVARVLPHFDNNLNMAMLVLCNFLLQQQGPHRPYIPLPLYNNMGAAPKTLLLIYDFLFLPCQQILDGLSRVIVDRMAPLYKPGFYGTYSAPSKTASFGVRCHQMQILACESFADYLTLMCSFESVVKSSHVRSASERERESGNPYLIDEMAAEMDTLARTRQPTLLLMLMLQLFVDMNFDRGSAAKRGWEELRAGSARMLTSLAERDKVESPIKPFTWPEQNEQLIGLFKEEARYWVSKEDPVTIVRKAVARDLPGSSQRQYESALMARNPLLCGVLLFRLQLKYQVLSLSLANCWGTVIYSGHLLVACKHSGTLPGMPELHWPDMDKVFAMHGEAEVFSGKVPDTVADSNIAFLRMTGFSTDVLQAMRNAGAEMPAHLRNRSRPRVMESKSGPRGLEDRTKLLAIFQRKYIGNESGARIDISVIEALLSDILARQEREEAKKQRKAGSAGSGAKRKLLRKERTNSNSEFKVPQLLSVLEAGLRLETESIRFDYVSMHVRCIRLLKAVKAASHEYLVRKIGTQYIEADYQLPFVVGWILQIAMLSGLAAQQLKLPNAGLKTGSRLLIGAADALRKFLADTKEGSAEINKLRLGMAKQ